MKSDYQKVLDCKNSVKAGYYDAEDIHHIFNELLKTMDQPAPPSMTPWIGVDFDGTLVVHESGQDLNNIGAVIEPMLNRIKDWLAQGITVKIFTARASHKPFIEPLQDYLETIGLPRLEVTNVKDFRMVQLWDDRAVQVVPNEGIPFKHPYESIG